MQIIGLTLGVRCKLYGYQYSKIFRSFVSAWLVLRMAAVCSVDMWHIFALTIIRLLMTIFVFRFLYANQLIT